MNLEKQLRGETSSQLLLVKFNHDGINKKSGSVLSVFLSWKTMSFSMFVEMVWSFLFLSLIMPTGRIALRHSIYRQVTTQIKLSIACLFCSINDVFTLDFFIHFLKSDFDFFFVLRPIVRFFLGVGSYNQGR